MRPTATPQPLFDLLMGAQPEPESSRALLFVRSLGSGLVQGTYECRFHVGNFTSFRFPHPDPLILCLTLHPVGECLPWGRACLGTWEPGLRESRVGLPPRTLLTWEIL